MYGPPEILGYVPCKFHAVTNCGRNSAICGLTITPGSLECFLQANAACRGRERMDGTFFGLGEATAFGGSLISTSGDTALSADKYSVAVIKAREIVSLSTNYKSNPQPDLKAKIVAKMDRLLGFLLSQFRPQTSADEVQPLFEGQKVDTLNEDELVKLPEGLIPVAIVRDLLFSHKVFVQPSKLNNWELFAQRYQAQII